MSSSCSSLTIDSCVRGYHEYSAIWEPVMGEELQCGREVGNPHDPYAVSVLKRRQIVGHVPRSISRPCLVFLRSHGTITCTVTGNRRYSSDLPQGGMEIPCSLRFTGDESWLKKLSNLFSSKNLNQPVADEPKCCVKIEAVECELGLSLLSSKIYLLFLPELPKNFTHCS